MAQPGGVAGPVLTRVTTVLSWAVALGLTAFTFDGEMTPEGEHTYDWKTASFNATIPLAVLGAAGFYLVVCLLFSRYGGALANELSGGYPNYCYWCSHVHCFLVLPACVYWMWKDHPEDAALQDFGPPHQAHSRGTTAAYVAILGYLLKDFHLYPLDVAFVAHHVFSVVGCVVCMFFPLLAGAVGIFGAQAEFASGTYNMVTSAPGSNVARVVYALIMGASQVLSAYISYLVWVSEMALWPWRGVFIILSILVQLLRTAGYVLFFIDWAKRGAKKAAANREKQT